MTLLMWHRFLAISTSRDNLEWRWVRYEGQFFNDILSGVKPTGRVYVEGVRILIASFLRAQTFVHALGAMEALSTSLQMP